MIYFLYSVLQYQQNSTVFKHMKLLLDDFLILVPAPKAITCIMEDKDNPLTHYLKKHILNRILFSCFN